MSSYDQHSADLAFSTFERSKDLGLKDGLEIDLAKVRLALERIDRGTYGYCLSCGNPLSQGRLNAMPDAELCVTCQEKQEVAPRNVRPFEEQLAYKHMGGFEELTDDVVMRGEDVSRAVKPFPNHISGRRK
jgi:DnaK suppressor protein